MDRLPLVDITAQAHRLRLASLLFFGGVVLANLAQLPALSVHAGVATCVLVGGGAMSLSGALLLLRGISCPRCGMHWAAWALRTKPALKWLGVLRELRQCPGCGYSSEGTAAQPNTSLQRSRDR